MKYINIDFCGKIPANYQELACEFKYFSCGEVEFHIKEDIENEEITIFQSFNVGKFNDDLMKLWVCCDVLKRNNVKSIKYIAPFLPYTRQDRSGNATRSVGSKILATIIKDCKINEVITYDPHVEQIDGVFDCKIKHLSAIPLFLKIIQEKYDLNNSVIVFPDAGSTQRFKDFFYDVNIDIAIIRKTRLQNGDVKTKLLGNVNGKDIIIIDDMIDGGRTVVSAMQNSLEFGAKNVDVYATHGIFSGNGVEVLNNSTIRKITITDSIKHDILPSKFEVIEL